MQDLRRCGYLLYCSIKKTLVKLLEGGFFLKYLFLKNFSELYLIYDVLISSVEQSHSVIHMYTYVFFSYILFHSGLSQDNCNITGY